MIVFSLPTSEQALFENLSSRSNWTRGHNASLITANPSLFYDGLGFKAPRLVIMACGEFHYEREDLDIVVKIRVFMKLTKKFPQKRREFQAEDLWAFSLPFWFAAEKKHAIFTYQKFKSFQAQSKREMRWW